jgi:hypothetical protein
MRLRPSEANAEDKNGETGNLRAVSFKNRVGVAVIQVGRSGSQAPERLSPHLDPSCCRLRNSISETSHITQKGNDYEVVSCPRNTRYFVAIKTGRWQGGPSRTGGRREHI